MFGQATELIKQLFALTQSVSRLQSDFEKLEKDHEKLLEKYIELATRVERIGAEAVIESNRTAVDTSSSMHGIALGRLAELEARLLSLEKPALVIEQTQDSGRGKPARLRADPEDG